MTNTINPISAAISVIILSKYNVVVEGNTNPQMYHVYRDISSDSITVRNNKSRNGVFQVMLFSDKCGEHETINTNGLITVTVKR
ncbi:MAG: hypothetical protein R2685_06280 [Candidatus Nitrosocosmicus sp.]|nr:hypothetical protein [Candidatus Nitrosocosmicus sp.]